MALFPILISDCLIAILGLLFLYAGVVSVLEKETRAASLFFVIGVVLLLLLLVFEFLDSGVLLFVSKLFISFFILLGLVFLLPIKGARRSEKSQSIPRFDEREIQFSRKRLKQDTENYSEFYTDYPHYKKNDDHLKTLPGLLSKESKKYHAFTFLAADSNFDTVELIKHHVDGHVATDQIASDPYKTSRFVSKWLKKQGAHSVGICQLREYHWYSISGKVWDYGSPIAPKHKYAIAFTVEMDKDMIDCAPNGPVVMESSKVYLSSGIMAVNVANFIRRMGYSARAHIDGNYEVICPLVARDAGLGELGRMGLLMTPKLGPRVRVAVVTTELPLEISQTKNTSAMLDFCKVCEKCAKNCPTRAIPFDDQKEESGIVRWRINSDACFSYWCTHGTDCGQCIRVCPYSHPNNLLHSFIRWGILNNVFFRRIAIYLDDFFYGSKPKPHKLPEWM